MKRQLLALYAAVSLLTSNPRQTFNQRRQIDNEAGFLDDIIVRCGMAVAAVAALGVLIAAVLKATGSI